MGSMGARQSFVLSALVAAACGSTPAPDVVGARLPQAAYVWQRNWTPGVREAVAHPLAALDGLHVLAAELDGGGDLTVMRLDAAALAASHRPITLVVRMSGSRPLEGVSLASVLEAGERLRGAGVNVAGLEIDHDCATARLPAYAAWLTAHRPAAPLRFSITALPTWAESPALAQVAAAVDDLVVQVHAVRAPMIFDANEAWADLAGFARAVRTTPMRVALPTYSAVVRGDEIGVDPDDVARFVRRLEARPIAGVGGVVWFRLPVAGDEQTWTAATFARVVTDGEPEVAGAVTDGAAESRRRAGGAGAVTDGAPESRRRAGFARAVTDGAAESRTWAGFARVVSAPGPDTRARVELVERGDDRFDVMVTNAGAAAVDLPPVRIAGAIDAADLVQGYRERATGRWDAPRRSLAPGAQIVIGWIHGKDLELVD